jgi:hypothetical protein
MRTAIIPLALVACFQAVQGFAPAAVGITRSSALPSARAISGIRGGSGLVAAKMASAYDFKLPLAGTRACASPTRPHHPDGRSRAAPPDRPMRVPGCLRAPRGRCPCRDCLRRVRRIRAGGYGNACRAAGLPLIPSRVP